MNTIYIGTRNLKQVIDEKKPISLVLLNSEQQADISKKDRENVKRMVSGALRHFYLLRFQAEQGFKRFKEDDDEIYLLVLALYQLRYAYKTTARFITVNQAVEAADELHLRFKDGEVRDYLQKIGSVPYQFPKEILSDPYKYNALFFSVPLWIVRMWAKEYGDEATMAILRSIGQKKCVYVRRNPFKISQEDLLYEGLYENTSFAKEAYIYHGLIPFGKQEDEKQGKAFTMDLSIQMALEKLPLDKVHTAVQFFGRAGRFAAALGIEIKNHGGKVLTCFDDPMNYRKARYLFEKLGLNEVDKAYNGMKEMVADLPQGKADFVAVTPHSSKLGEINKNPALLTLIHEEDMPSIIKEEKAELEEGSRLVEEGGYLFYAVFTMNEEEGEKAVEDFLDGHKDFSLVQKKQIFPHDFSSDGLYYALVRKETNGTER